MKNWKKIFLSLSISVGLLASAVPAIAAPQQPAVKVDNQVVQYSLGTPIIDKGTTLVPLRTTLQALDVKLKGTANDTIHVVVDGKTITLKGKLKQINGVTYAPI